MKLKIKGRLSFPDLFTPRAFKEGDEPKYKATILVPKGSAHAKEIDDAIVSVAKEKWPKSYEKTLNGIRGNANKFCFQDGDNKDYDGYEGMMAFSANNKARPTVVDRDRTPLTQNDGKPYAGCYVVAIVEIFAYETGGNGISANLTGVQFDRDGDAFSAGRPAGTDDFDDLSDGAADDLI